MFHTNSSILDSTIRSIAEIKYSFFCITRTWGYNFVTPCKRYVALSSINQSSFFYRLINVNLLNSILLIVIGFSDPYDKKTIYVPFFIYIAVLRVIDV